jgi:hypothetical protein
VFPLSFPVPSQNSQSAVTKASGIAKPRIFTFHYRFQSNERQKRTKGVRKKR